MAQAIRQCVGSIHQRAYLIDPSMPKCGKLAFCGSAESLPIDGSLQVLGVDRRRGVRPDHRGNGGRRGLAR